MNSATATNALVPLDRRDYEALRKVIRELTGIHLPDGKHALVANRLQKRLRVLGLGSYRAYLDLLRTDPDGPESRELINAITTNKTSFFREPHHFEFLMKVVVPEIEARARAGQERKIRIWSAACSTGQEPWTIAIALKRALGNLSGWDIRILASDLDTEVLREAEEARYSTEAIQEVPVSFRESAFEKLDAHTWTVSPELRRLVTFRQINLVEQPWPIKTKFDAVFCRNVAIYFDRETQRALFEGLARSLVPTGYLFSGHSENLHWMSDVLTPAGNTVHQLRSAARPSIKPGLRGVAPGRVSLPKMAKVTAPAPQPAREVSIQSGEVHASGGHETVKTLLGSCVSVCLFDPVRRVGGMNHFMLPHGGGSTLDPAYFGIHAMELLINKLLKLGASRERLVAKVFGASQLRDDSGIAANNASFAISFLEDEKIAILARKLGGRLPLAVHFDVQTGLARVREVVPPKGQAVRDPDLDGEVSSPTPARAPDDDVFFFGAKR